MSEDPRPNPRAIDRVECPFEPCGGWPHIIPFKPDALIEQHNMFNFINGNPEGTPCPASLMKWPLGDAERRALAEQKRAWQPLIDASEDPSHPRWQRFMKKQPPSKSQPLRGIHRLGREPPPRSKAWALGGRADEDVIPSGDERRGTVPQGVDGRNVGGSGMLSELAGLINAAGANAAEARTAIGQAIEGLDRAKGAIMEAIGQASSEKLNDYLTFLLRAETECQDAQGQIDAAHDKGQDFIRGFSS